MKDISSVGIVLSSALSQRSGGPSGYLWGLKEGFKDKRFKPQFYTLNYSNRSVDSIFISGVRKLFELLKNNINSSEHNRFSFILFEICYIILEKYKWKSNKEYYSNALKKDMLHFHIIYDLYFFKKYYKYSGKCILTMHAPEPFSHEIVSTFKDNYNKDYNYPIIRKFYEKIENESCKMADYFIFPSKEAEMVYRNFDFYKNNCENKICKYLITGIKSETTTKDNLEIRKEIGIAEKDFIVLYCGRHNKIKGYDILVKAFPGLQKKDVNVVCAGKVSPSIAYPNNNRWIELGWRKDIYNLISAADAIVLPNRSTYFDLVAIEALSSRKIIIASDTGGNITLSRYTDGVILFKNKNVKDLVSKIVMVKNMTSEARSKLEEENINFFHTYCTLESFASHYTKIIEEIVNNNN